MIRLKLQHTPRTGWLKVGVRAPVESIAAHMYRLGVMALTVPARVAFSRRKLSELGVLDAFLAVSTSESADKNDADNDDADQSDADGVVWVRVDAARCVKMALIHDLGEAIVGGQSDFYYPA